MADSNSTPEVSAADKTKSIIEDAFRRADKNDDGCLSLEEFQKYFSDGSMSQSQLKELFTTIDTHNTNNIDIGELCDYFSKYWGPFQALFASLDDLNRAVTEGIRATAQQYNQKTLYEQFATRYLMKEALSHVCAVEKPLDNVTTSLEEMAIQNRTDEAPILVEDTVPEKKTAVPRWQLKLEKRISEQLAAAERQNSSVSYETGLGKEVSRLAGLVDKMEAAKVNFQVIDEEITTSDDKMVLLVSYDIIVPAGTDQQSSVARVGEYIQQYVLTAKTQDGCHHVSIRRYVSEDRFGIYEVWEDTDKFKSYEDSVARQTFKNGCSEYLKKCETFAIPNSWWSSS